LRIHRAGLQVLNHRMLRHPHVIEFKEVLLTQEHLGIAMEYASGVKWIERDHTLS
jgi:hypothetical protein